jgi:hypothetical protein
MATKKLVLILGVLGSMLMLFVMGGGILTAALLYQPHGKKIALKGGSELYYTSNITDDEVQKVATLLNEKVIKEDSHKGTYQLTKVGGKYQFRAVIQPGKEKEAEVPFLALGYLISIEALKNVPLEVHLCDDQLNTVKVIEIKTSGSEVQPAV